MGKLDLSNKKCFKYQGYGHFQAECPNRKAFSLMEIQAIEESLQEDEENEDYGHEDGAAEEEEEEVMQRADEGEMLVIRRALHSKSFPHEELVHIYQGNATIHKLKSGN